MNILTELLKAFLPDQDGFVFMWILAFLALSALTLIIEWWLNIRRRTNVDAEHLIDRLKVLIKENKSDEAYRLCCTAGKRALPRIVGAGIKRAGEPTEIILSAMEEESLHLIPILERRVNYILMLGNVSTLLRRSSSILVSLSLTPLLP